MGIPVVPIAALVSFLRMFELPVEGAAGRALIPDNAMDEFVTVATYDTVVDAHIALGRLSAEGIEARLFDENMVQVAGPIALGGIKLRVSRGDEKAARAVLETDYSKTLEDQDIGRRED